MLYAISGLSTLVSFGCLLYVIFKMFEEEGALHAFLGFCCCQLYAYIWGWLKLDKDVKMKVMIVWTISILVGSIASATLQAQLASQAQQQLIQQMQEDDGSVQPESTEPDAQ